MIRNSRFWLSMAVFQVAFGLAVFALTRQYYIPDEEQTNAGQPVTQWTDPGQGSDLENLISTFPGPTATDDPVALSRQADDAFSSRQYDQAARLYERLLAVGPGDVETYNNLGITLHYLGRSAEALQVLNRGVAVDSAYQRIWLTLGFVNSQLGDIEQARLALTTAAQMDPASEVGQSASQMLEAL